MYLPILQGSYSGAENFFRQALKGASEAGEEDIEVRQTLESLAVALEKQVGVFPGFFEPFTQFHYKK